MPQRAELAGRRFGMLVAIRRCGKDLHGAWLWECRCDCGSSVQVRGATLTAGRTSACASCAVSKANTTHGMSRTPLYYRWRAMLQRCNNPKHESYSDYGGRGIRVCERWHQFENFRDDMAASFQEHLEIDRRDNDGHYCPENCRWATPAQQRRNQRTNHRLTFRGETLPVVDWATRTGLKPNTIITRIRRGWSVERALSKRTPA